MEQNYVTFGTGEVDLGSQQDELWDKYCNFLGQEKLILSHNNDDITSTYCKYNTIPGLCTD